MSILRNVFLIFIGVVIATALILGLVALGKVVFAPQNPINPDPNVIDNPSVVPGPTCEDRAKMINAPIGSSICEAPTLGAPATRVQSGSQIVFGTITFDAETRVWILEKFVVPNYANYAYDYEGRESNVLDAPFVVGSELNPVNGEKFTICWETTSDGCVPPTEIQFFQ